MARRVFGLLVVCLSGCATVPESGNNRPPSDLTVGPADLGSGAGDLRLPGPVLDLTSGAPDAAVAPPDEAVPGTDLATPPDDLAAAADLARAPDLAKMSPPDLARNPNLTNEPCKPGTPNRACYSGPAGTRNVGACSDGNQVCDSSGFWTKCFGDKRPTNEICNGIDDDCNGTIDNGCPEDGAPLGTEDTKHSDFFGLSGKGDTTFTGDCKNKSLAGFYGNAGEAVDRFGLYCGTLTIKEDRSQVPYRYSVVVADLAKGADQWGGTAGTEAFDSPCASDEVVTSFQATTHTTYSSLFGLQFRCSKFSVVSDASGFKVKAVDGLQSPLIGAKNCSNSDCVAQPAFSTAGGIYSISGAFGAWPKTPGTTVINGVELYSWTGFNVKVR